MAEIELAPLCDRFDEDELKSVARGLHQAGAKYDVEADHPSRTIAARLSEDAMTEFLDRLEAHDVGAEIFIPVEFDGNFTVGEHRVASSQALAAALEELRDELDVEEEDEDEDEDEEEDEDEDDDLGDDSIIAAQLKNIWRLMNDACEESVERGIPLHVRI
jgi:hypothetical protein